MGRAVTFHAIMHFLDQPVRWADMLGEISLGKPQASGSLGFMA
jgi:hypothetical protein